MLDGSRAAPAITVSRDAIFKIVRAGLFFILRASFL